MQEHVQKIMKPACGHVHRCMVWQDAITTSGTQCMYMHTCLHTYICTDACMNITKSFSLSSTQRAIIERWWLWHSEIRSTVTVTTTVTLRLRSCLNDCVTDERIPWPVAYMYRCLTRALHVLEAVPGFYRLHAASKTNSYELYQSPAQAAESITGPSCKCSCSRMGLGSMQVAGTFAVSGSSEFSQSACASRVSFFSPTFLPPKSCVKSSCFPQTCRLSYDDQRLLPLCFGGEAAHSHGHYHSNTNNRYSTQAALLRERTGHHRRSSLPLQHRLHPLQLPLQHPHQPSVPMRQSQPRTTVHGIKSPLSQVRATRRTAAPSSAQPCTLWRTSHLILSQHRLWQGNCYEQPRKHELGFFHWRFDCDCVLGKCVQRTGGSDDSGCHVHGTVRVFVCLLCVYVCMYVRTCLMTTRDVTGSWPCMCVNFFLCAWIGCVCLCAITTNLVNKNGASRIACWLFLRMIHWFNYHYKL